MPEASEETHLDCLKRLCDIADQKRAAAQVHIPRCVPAPSDSVFVDRARTYVDKMPPAISGQGGHNQTLCVARVLVHDFALHKSDAWALLNEYNARCQPVWSEKELRHKLSEAQKLSQEGRCQNAYGSLRDAQPEQCSEEPAVNISALLPAPQEESNPTNSSDPGVIPEELLRVPGFISEVMDYSLKTAPYPNQVMAFCGALALQSFLAGRKVCDPGDNRTNLYLLGLAHSAAGKDWPRKINTRIIHQIGLSGSIGDRFASGEGIQDSLFASPCMLFQTDEIDGLLQSINKAKDARHENIMGTLLTMYSSANSVFPMRAKAGKESIGFIDQPCLVIFGTAIPNHYYEALSERMLTNGFFARMIILENARRGKGQEPARLEIPSRVIETASWWSDFRPGNGNLQQWHPIPIIIEHEDDAKPILIATREQAEAEYTKAENNGDPVGTTVWGRVNEQVRKLSLIHAVSANHQAPRIDEAAATWASQFVLHQTRRMLFMAESHVSDNGFHAKCKKVLGLLLEWKSQKGTQWMPYWRISRKLPWTEREHDEVRASLLAQNKIEFSTASTGGRPSKCYRMK